jgi:hypothetical protein
VHELDQRGLILERRRHPQPPSAAEHKACLGAVAPHLLDVGVGQVLGERTERSDRGEHVPPDELPVFLVAVIGAALVGDTRPTSS